MKRTWRKVVSVFLALAMVFLALPEYVKPVKTAKAEGESEDKKIYVLTDSMTSTGKYLIVAGQTAGSSFALMHDGENADKDAVTIKQGNTESEGALYIDGSEVDEKSIWEFSVEDNHQRLHNGDYYLQIYGQTPRLHVTYHPYVDDEVRSDFNWYYRDYSSTGQDVKGLYVTYFVSQLNNYITERLVYNNENEAFGGTASGNSNVYIFVEKTIHKHDWQFQKMEWTTGWTYNHFNVSAKAVYKLYSCYLRCGICLGIYCNCGRYRQPQWNCKKCNRSYS